MRSEAHEQAADAAADRVTRMSGGATDWSRARSGSPLDPATRAFMETRFEHDFSRVRVHTDDKAAESARSLNALAYTSRNDIVLGREALALDSAGGRRLLAHELAHVVQQANGVAEGIQRKPPPFERTNYRFDTARITEEDLSDPEILERIQAMSRQGLRAYRARVADPAVKAYLDGLLAAPRLATVEENRIEFKKADIEQLRGRGYWWPRTSAAYDVQRTDRFTKSPEEEEAVYATVWGLWPDGAPSGAVVEVVTIPPSAQRKNALLYRISVNPPAAAGQLPQLSFQFISERAGSVVQSAPQPPAKYKAPAKLEFASSMNIDEQWLNDHPEEKRQITFWLEQQTGSFDGVIVTRSVPPKGPPIETTIRLKGTKQKDKSIPDLSIELLDDRRPPVQDLPGDYRDRDYGDLMLHEAQAKSDPKLGDRLEFVDLTGVPPNETLAVKYAIASYWKNGTRNAEVDAVLPVPGSAKSVFYTFRFRSNKEVDVERIGEQGATAKLDPQKLDVARARGFDENSGDATKLKTWLGKRYPGVKPAGATVQDLRDSANKAMIAGAGAAKWYDDNYKIVVLDSGAAKTRLQSMHKLKDPQVPDVKSFPPHELVLAELSLQTLTDRILPLTKSLRLARQGMAHNPDGTERLTTGNRKVGAQMLSKGAERTIVVYDQGATAKAGGFFGGAEGVHDPRASLITHEIGHSLEAKLGTTKAFNKFVKREGIAPFTGYSKEDPEKEFFAEAFAMYQTDPEYLRKNHYQVYAWLDELNKTGKVPK